MGHTKCPGEHLLSLQVFVRFTNERWFCIIAYFVVTEWKSILKNTGERIQVSLSWARNRATEVSVRSRQLRESPSCSQSQDSCHVDIRYFLSHHRVLSGVSKSCMMHNVTTDWMQKEFWGPSCLLLNQASRFLPKYNWTDTDGLTKLFLFGAEKALLKMYVLFYFLKMG